MINIQLELDGELMDFNMPTSWSEITIETAGKIYSINVEGKTKIESSVEIISILTGIETDYLYMLTPQQFGEIVEATKFTNEEIKGELVDSIVIGEEEYFLKKDFSQLTMGEVISIETILKQFDNNYMAALPQLLCIFLRKKKENGALESFKNSFMERANIFKNIIITDVNNLLIFFSGGNNTLVSNMKDYLEEESNKIENEIDLQSLTDQQK
jgi:hypothetical protein